MEFNQQNWWLPETPSKVPLPTQQHTNVNLITNELDYKNQCLKDGSFVERVNFNSSNDIHIEDGANNIPIHPSQVSQGK